MQPYIASLVVGLIVGVLFGLLGIVGGEAAVPFVKHLIRGHPPAAAWEKTGRGAAALGRLPGDAALTRSPTNSYRAT